MHEGGDGIHLGRGARTGELGGHDAPKVGGGPEIGTAGGIVVGGVGVGAVARGGVVPEFHDLGHGGGHAARG